MANEIMTEADKAEFTQLRQDVDRIDRMDGRKDGRITASNFVQYVLSKFSPEEKTLMRNHVRAVEQGDAGWAKGQLINAFIEPYKRIEASLLKFRTYADDADKIMASEAREATERGRDRRDVPLAPPAVQRQRDAEAAQIQRQMHANTGHLNLDSAQRAAIDQFTKDARLDGAGNSVPPVAPNNAADYKAMQEFIKSLGSYTKECGIEQPTIEDIKAGLGMPAQPPITRCK